MEQSANSLPASTERQRGEPQTACGQSAEKLKPRKYRKTKLTIYALVILALGFYVYANFIQPQSKLTQTSVQSANQLPSASPSSRPAGYWDKSNVAVPTYPPITNSTDLSASASEIDIPDFTDQITSLKELIAK